MPRQAKILVISFRVTPEEKVRIESLCRLRKHKDISSCIRAALRFYLGA